MLIRVGLLTKGHDHLILRAYLARLLNVPDGEIEADYPDGTGHGHDYVAVTIDRALRRFYGGCAQMAIISMDNDGNLDLRSQGGQEDPTRPRHWLHRDAGPLDRCRWCFIHNQVEKTRPALNWIPSKHGARWPIVIAVPVESIEAWLLTTQAILVTGTGSLHAEQERRAACFLAPAPPAPAGNPNLGVNLNYVHGLSYDKPQTVMPPWLWLGIMLVGFPVIFYLPTHLALSAWFPRRGKAELGDDGALSAASSNQGCPPCC